MRSGTVKCICGKTFYIESLRDYVLCIECGKKHDITHFTEQPQEVAKEGSDES